MMNYANRMVRFRDVCTLYALSRVVTVDNQAETLPSVDGSNQAPDRQKNKNKQDEPFKCFQSQGQGQRHPATKRSINIIIYVMQ